MKSIKFDLNINGVKVRTLDVLQENVTAEILTLYRKGTLQRWLQSYGYETEKENVAAIVDSDDEKSLLISLGAALGVEVPEEVADYLLEQTATAVPEESRETSGVEQISEPATADSAVAPARDKAAPGSSTEDRVTGKPQGFDGWEEAEKVEFLSRQDIEAQWQEELVREGEPAIRQALSRNRSLDARWHLFLCETGSKEVRTALAENPSIDSAVQNLLGSDNEWEVRRALAKNPALAVDLYTELGSDKDRDVRAAFLMNPSLPDELQQEKYEAATPENMPQKVDQTKAATALVVALASNPALSLALQERLTGDLHWGVSQCEVRAALAANRTIGEKIQARLLASGDEAVLRGLASNSALAVACQHELRTKGSLEVQVTLFRNPAVSAAVRQKLIQTLGEDDLSTLESRKKYARSRYESLSEEANVAQNKAWDYGHDGLFWSAEKREKLDRDATYANRRSIDAWNEWVETDSFVNGMKKLLDEKVAVTG
jgi:hypothetical protein